MLLFLLRRLVWMAFTVWVVYTVTFILVKLVPGGPFASERNVPDAIKRNLEARYGLDEPAIVQYGLYIWHAVQFDFGPSFKLKDYTVAEIVAQGLPVSASLGVFALIFALTLGMTAGVVSAVRRHSYLDVGFMSAATVGVAMPNFVLASFAIIVFVFIFDLFPPAGWGDLRQLVLPALCLGAPFAGYIARLTRTGMLEVLGQDYIRTAYAKGLEQRRVVLRHALRGAILPVVSYLGPATAGILTGSVVLEKMFVLPGMANHFVEAAMQRDHMLTMGMTLVYTVLLFVMNTLVDLSYAIIDPRVKLE